MAICAKLGNSKINTSVLRRDCDTGGSIKPYRTSTVLTYIKSKFRDYRVCNGGHFSILVSTGKRSYKGYEGSIDSAKDGGNSGGDCIVMCSA